MSTTGCSSGRGAIAGGRANLRKSSPRMAAIKQPLAPHNPNKRGLLAFLRVICHDSFIVVALSVISYLSIVRWEGCYAENEAKLKNF